MRRCHAGKDRLICLGKAVAQRHTRVGMRTAVLERLVPDIESVTVETFTIAISEIDVIGTEIK